MLSMYLLDVYVYKIISYLKFLTLTVNKNYNELIDRIRIVLKKIS